MIEQLLGDELDGAGAYLAELIYGANDGIVTTFAVVAGVAGAALEPSIVLVLGVANLLADGFSMGMSNYLSRKSELEYRAAANDAGGTNAAGDVAGGDSPGDDNAAGSVATGPDDGGKAPARTALATFVAFVLAGWAPLLPYVLVIRPLFEVAIAVTGAAFFVVGASRSLVTRRSWLRSGAEMFAVGMLAAAVAYATGTLLGGIA